MRLLNLMPIVPSLRAAIRRAVAKLKADARNTVGIIGGDKAKIQTYCQIVDLGRQMNQAVGQKDQKKAKVLVQLIVQLQKQLPEFIVLSNIVKRADPNSPDGQEITAIIRSLNQS